MPLEHLLDELQHGLLRRVRLRDELEHPRRRRVLIEFVKTRQERLLHRVLRRARIRAREREEALRDLVIFRIAPVLVRDLKHRRDHRLRRHVKLFRLHPSISSICLPHTIPRQKRQRAPAFRKQKETSFPL